MWSLFRGCFREFYCLGYDQGNILIREQDNHSPSPPLVRHCSNLSLPIILKPLKVNLQCSFTSRIKMGKTVSMQHNTRKINGFHFFQWFSKESPPQTSILLLGPSIVCVWKFTIISQISCKFLQNSFYKRSPFKAISLLSICHRAVFTCWRSRFQYCLSSMQKCPLTALSTKKFSSSVEIMSNVRNSRWFLVPQHMYVTL